MVMLLAVAAITTATAAFYFNYAATEASTCCVVAQSSSTLQLSDQQTNSASASAVEPNRGRFGSTVLHASKFYAVCKIHDYRRRILDRVSTYTFFYFPKCVGNFIKRIIIWIYT